MLVLSGSHWRFMVYKTKAQVCYWEWTKKGDPSPLTFNVSPANSCLGWWHCHRTLTSEGILGESLCTSFPESFFFFFFNKEGLVHLQRCDKTAESLQGCSLQVICFWRIWLCLLQWVRWGWWKSARSCDCQLEGQDFQAGGELVGGENGLAALWRRVSGHAASTGRHQSCFYFITLVEVMPYSSVCGER